MNIIPYINCIKKLINLCKQDQRQKNYALIEMYRFCGKDEKENVYYFLHNARSLQ